MLNFGIFVGLMDPTLVGIPAYYVPVGILSAAVFKPEAGWRPRPRATFMIVLINPSANPSGRNGFISGPLRKSRPA